MAFNSSISSPLAESSTPNRRKNGQSLTVNGLYLTDTGDKLLAPEIFRGIFDETPPDGDFEKLREAINDKNWIWHTRYRTMDGYNVYGGRSRLRFPFKDGQQITNFDVMQEEMSQRDVMTANRDKRVSPSRRAAI
jgi:hypothetical protein